MKQPNYPAEALNPFFIAGKLSFQACALLRQGFMVFTQGSEIFFSLKMNAALFTQSPLACGISFRPLLLQPCMALSGLGKFRMENRKFLLQPQTGVVLLPEQPQPVLQ